MADPKKTDQKSAPDAAPATEVAPIRAAAPESAPPAPQESKPDRAAREKTEREEDAKAEADFREVQRLEKKAEALRLANRKKALQEEIDSLEHGGKSAGQIQRLRESEKRRAQTFKITGPDGKVICKYQLKDLAFRQGALVPAGTVVDLPFEELPGQNMLPVEPIKPRGEAAFAAVG